MVPKKVKNRATLWPSNCTTEYLPKESKTLIQRDTCTPMFIATLFTIAKIWKQPKCPLMDEWIKKKWYIHTLEYYSAIKMKSCHLQRHEWRMPYDFIHVWNLRNKTNEQRGKKERERDKPRKKTLDYRELMLTRGGNGGGGGWNRWWGLKRVLVMSTWWCTELLNYYIVYLKLVEHCTLTNWN